MSIIKGCDELKLSTHTRDKVSGLTNHDLATPSMGLKISSENEKADDNVVRATKMLIRKTFSRNYIGISSPCIVLNLYRGY